MLLKYATSEFPALAISAHITLEIWCLVLEQSKGLPLETKNAEKKRKSKNRFYYVSSCTAM